MEFNKAINPKEDEGYISSLVPCRAERIKEVKRMRKGGMAGGATNLVTGTVFVPMEETAEGRTIRLHEAMHAAHTGSKAKPRDLLDQALEDARLHRYFSKTAASSYDRARRDELAVALRDLRASRRLPSGPQVSLITLRALAILLADSIKPSHENLANEALSRLGGHAKRDFIAAIAGLRDCSASMEGRAWENARKSLREYFAASFAPPPPTKGTGKDSSASKLKSESEDVSREEEGDFAAESESGESEEAEESESEEEESESEGEGKGDSEDGMESEAEEDGRCGEDGGKMEGTEGGKTSTDTETGTGSGMGEEEREEDSPEPAMAPVKEPPKPKARKAHPDEYTADLAPECDRKEFEDMSEKYPLKMYVRRLDMSINRVKLNLGRKSPMPVMAGHRILARKLAASITPGARVFARDVSEGGYGTIVIDASGSMSIPEYILIEFLAAAPALTLAFYNAPNDMSKEGNLYIYAANGYRANSPHIGYGIRFESGPRWGGGNVIDYHVMAWLLKQPRPHYLVSDREWTGDWARASSFLCEKLEKAKELTVVPDLEAMQRILEEKRRKR